MKISEIFEFLDKAKKNLSYEWVKPQAYKEMESKLRAIHELMPEIKYFITAFANVQFQRGFPTEMEKELLAKLEVWENE